MLDLPRNRMTLVELVRAQAEAYGDREFARMKEGRALTFRELEERSSALAERLAALGVGEGDRVTAVLENCLEMIVLLIAANKRNAIFVPLNPDLRGMFLEHQMRNSRPKVLLVDKTTAAAFASVGDPGPELERVLVVGEPATFEPGAFWGRAIQPFADFEKEPADAVPNLEPKPGDVSAVIYTSGTTGPSKGVMMPQAHCVLLGANLAKVMKLTDADIYYVCMPLFHTNALFMQTVGSLVAGARIVIVRRFSASAWLSDIRAFGATVTNGLGVIPEFIFRQPPTEHDSDNQLRAVMAVPIAAEWGEAFQGRFGVSLVQGFGLSEANIVAYSAIGDPVEPGCAGHILEDDYEVRIVDPATDEPMPNGKPGEIVVRPKHPWIFMAGYLEMPERTVEAWRNLWFHTGDAGYFDAKGRLFYMDRIKDTIRRRGENIASYEVEQVLNIHPAIAESAVIAAKSEIPGGEDEVKAVIVFKPGETAMPEEIVQHCAGRMPRYAVPRFLEFLPELPKTATGKIQKQALRQKGNAADVWDLEKSGVKLPRR